MKRSPQGQKLEDILRSSKLVAGGFMGRDTRPLDEIVDSDAADVAMLKTTTAEIAARMRQITELAERGLGTTVQVNDHLQATATDTRGHIPCPWPHPGRFRKVVVLAERTDTGQSIRWSALSIHMIETHGFFEGRGSAFRLDPQELVRLIF